MSAQFFNFFLFLFGIFFFWCVFIIVVRGSFPGMIILGENITFKAFFCPYCKRKTKTLFYSFFPSIDACKHSWFFHSKHKVFNCTSSPKWAPLMYIFFIFSYWILSFVWFALFLGFRGFKEISESKGRIFFFETLRDQCVMAHNVVKIGWFHLEEMLI